MRKKISILLIIIFTITLSLPSYIFQANEAKATITITPMLAGGSAHTLALKADGTVWSWGLNSYEQLGNNTTINSSVPVHVQSLSYIVAIAGG